LPAFSLHDALWWALAATIAVLGAVLLWIVVTPVSPLGAWRPAEVRVMSPTARSALFAQVDPFNRGGAVAVAAGPGAVTSLALTLFGVRVNAATGGGSAIIAGADGLQQVYLTGSEVQPGVTLSEIHFDHVALTRNGGTELLYLDQSKPAPAAATVLAASPAGPVGVSPGAAPLSVAGLREGLAIQPQAGDNGRVNGLQVSPEGDGSAFRAAGFQPGDVIVGVAGRPVGNAGDGVALLNSLKPGGSVAVTVQRGGKQLPLAITVSR
jgi:general secretion pathway protein C